MANTRFKTHHGVYSTANSFIDGKLEVTGDLSVSGNVAFSGTSQGDLKPDADQRNLGNTSFRWNLNGFFANLASTLTANGATSLGNTLGVSGAATLQNTLTVVGWVNTAANLVIGGSANISGQVNIAGNTAVVGIFTANGNTSFTNGLLIVNTNSGTNANTLTVGAANLSVDSGVLFVDAINNRVGINNTAPGVALRVTGAVDISLTANVQGNANVGGTFGVAGITTLSANAVLSGDLQTISGNVNFDSGTLFVDATNNRVGIGNSAPSVPLQVSGTVNAQSFTVNADLVANTSGVYHIGTVNAAVLSTSGVTVNTTAVMPASNSILLGNTTRRWIFSANSIDITNNITSTGSILVGNSTTNSVITSSDIVSSTDTSTTGTISVSGATTVTGVGTLFTTQLAAGDVIKFSGCTSLFTVNSVTNTTQFTLTSNGPTLSANTLTKRFSQVVNNSGVFITGGSQTISPFSNTTNSSIGTSTARWDVYSNTINSSGLITGSAGASFTGSVNASTSFNVSSNLVANTSGVYHTGTVNAASHTTSGVTANASGVYPSSNTTGTELGSSTSRWTLVANTGTFAGPVSGITTLAAGNTSITGFANVSLSVNSALLSVGTIVIANTSGVSVGNTTVKVEIANNGVITTFGASAGIQPSTNTSGHNLGTTTRRWTLFANNVDSLNLTANGSVGSAGQVLFSGGSGNTYWSEAGITVTDDTSTNGTRYLLFDETTSGSTTNAGVSSTKLTFNPSTGILSAVEFSATSDKQLKTDVETISDALTKVIGMRGVSFTFTDTGKRSIGVIAQEVESIIPEVVNTNEKGFKSVNYGNLVGLLIEAIKELKQEIEELKNGNKS